MKKELSNCCHAPINTMHSLEGTLYWQCSICLNGCDPIICDYGDHCKDGNCPHHEKFIATQYRDGPVQVRKYCEHLMERTGKYKKTCKFCKTTLTWAGKEANEDPKKGNACYNGNHSNCSWPECRCSCHMYHSQGKPCCVLNPCGCTCHIVKGNSENDSVKPDLSTAKLEAIRSKSEDGWKSKLQMLADMYQDDGYEDIIEDF